MVCRSLFKWFMFSALAVTGIGCGARQDVVLQRVDTLTREIQDLTESHKALNQRIERLQDRLALVEDKSESQSLHRQIRAQLPLVKIEPKTAPEPIDDSPPATITQEQIDALNGRRGGRTSGRKTRGPVPLPANARRAGNVGVVPVKGTQRTPSGVGGPRLKDDDPVAAFKTARSLYVGGNLSKSLKAFSDFIRRWPSHRYADNALYWLGRGRFERAEYPAALKILKRVLRDYPTGNQVPPTLLMLGLTLDRLGQPREARATLERLTALYPETKAAKRAANMLKSGQDGP
ncbi:MAG: tetratricopeptide repeat protein [Myxococcota bacterium]|nr:tetratricopeptide repeat protein [Myxococcota bacterium]